MKYLLTSIFVFFTYILFSQEAADKYFKEGNNNYLKKFYDEASANYVRAIQEGSDTYKVNYNLGNAMYRLKKYDDAVFQYEKSTKLAENQLEETDAHFNLGNAYYKKKDYESAARAFKKVLKLNPKDETARYNYALCKENIKKQQEQQKKEQEKEEEKEEKDTNQKENSKESPNEKQPDNQKNNNYGQSGGQKDNQAGQGAGEEQGVQNIESSSGNEMIDREDRQYYDGILEGIGEKEKRTQQRIINKKIPPSERKAGKDW